MADEYIRREDVTKMCGDWYVEQGEEEGFIGTVNQMLGMFPPADVVPYSISDDGTMTITVPKGMAVGRVFVQRR